MQRTRKLIALLTAFVLSLSLAVSVSALEFSDVPSDYKYYEAITFLSTQGVIDGYTEGDFRPEAQVSREEFAKMMAIALNVGNIGLGSQGTGFTDVASDRWSAQYIAVLTSMGIINGMGDGTFAPESPVTYEQAIKMCVVALGYEVRAEASGGYPDGYNAVGTQIGITKRISDGVFTEPALRGTIAQLIYNTLNTDKMAEDGTVTDGDTLLNGKRLTGQVTAVRDISLDPNRTSTCRTDEIEITANGSRENYSFGTTGLTTETARELLGKSVQFYYEETTGSDVKALTFLNEQANRNETMRVDAEDIDSMTATTIEYSNEETDYDTEEVSVGGAYIMLNGKPTAKSLADIDLTEGYVECLDSQGTGSYDVVFVQSYKTIYVNRIDRNNYKLYDYYDNTNTVTLDEKDSSSVITIKKDGQVVTFNDIPNKSIVSVAESDPASVGDRFVEVLVSTESFTGTVQEITEGSNELTINGEKYTLSGNYQEYLAKGSAEDLSIDTTATFYLDSFGRIAAAEVTAAKSYEYGYIAAVNDEVTRSGSSYLLQVMMMLPTGSASGATMQYLNQKVRIDGVSYDLSRDSDLPNVISALTVDSQYNAQVDADHKPLNTDMSQIVKYTTNNSGYIDKIITYKSGDSGSTNSILVDTSYMGDGVEYTGNNSFDAKFTVDSSVKIFFVPDNRQTYAEYMRKTVGALSEGINYHVQVIDAVDNGPAKALVIFEPYDAAAIDSTMPYAIITSGVGTMTQDGEEVQYIMAMQEGDSSPQRYYAEQDISFDGLNIGDVVRFRVDGDTVVNIETEDGDIKKMVDVNDMEFGVTDNGGTGRNSIKTIFGTAMSLSGTGDARNLTVVTDAPTVGADGTPTLGESNRSTYQVGDVDVYLYDSAASSDDRMVTTSVIDEVYGFDNSGADASTVFCLIRDNVLSMVIIYR